MPSETSFQEDSNQRIRKRKKLWFNPPYSSGVKTNVLQFLQLLQYFSYTSQSTTKCKKHLIKNCQSKLYLNEKCKLDQIWT